MEYLVTATTEQIDLRRADSYECLASFPGSPEGVEQLSAYLDQEQITQVGLHESNKATVEVTQALADLPKTTVAASVAAEPNTQPTQTEPAQAEQGKPLSRREMLAKMFGFAGAAAVGGVIGNKMTDLSDTFLLRDIEAAMSKSIDNELERHFGRGEWLQVYPGEGPLHMGSQRRPSVFVSSATQSIVQGVEQQLEGKVVQVDADDPRLRLDPTNNLIMLGGPISNMIAGVQFGYDYDNPSGIPRFYDQTRFRWGFDCGDEQLGVHDGHSVWQATFEPLSKKLIWRHDYRIIDTNSRNTWLELPPPDSNGFMQSDALIVTRRNSDDYNKPMMHIAGLHGYSVQQFGKDLQKNLKKLHSLTKGIEQYQVLVPLSVNNDLWNHVTTAELLWDKALVEEI